jgi:hypothetical protein
MATSQVVIGTTWTLLGTRIGTTESPGKILIENLGAVIQVSDNGTTAGGGQVLAAGTPTVPGGVLSDSGPGSASWGGWVASGSGLAAVTVSDV